MLKPKDSIARELMVSWVMQSAVSCTAQPGKLAIYKQCACRAAFCVSIVREAANTIEAKAPLAGFRENSLKVLAGIELIEATCSSLFAAWLQMD